MREYLDLVKHILDNGTEQKNRTGVDTLSCFAYFYQVDLQKGFPLLTTKKVNFNAIVHEFFWYLSGEAHIRNLRDKTKIWGDWASEKGLLETAYGRFWRRYPVPSQGAEGEKWGTRWVSTDPETGEKVFDQIRYIVDTLKEIKKKPTTRNLRRMVVTAWHPGNAAESKLPPCHYTFCLSVIGDRLNCHLTQRSGDVALGIPFNLACYSLLTMMLAQEAGFIPGNFAHTIINAHIYLNHVQGLKEQLTRQPRPLPRIEIAPKPFFELNSEDIKLKDYDPHPGIKFEVAV